MRKLDFALAPVILGFVLGALFEDNLRRALFISGGDWAILLSTAESFVLYALAILVVVVPAFFSRRARLARAVAAGKD